MVAKSGRQAHGWVAVPLLLLVLTGCGTPASTAVASLVSPTRTPTLAVMMGATTPPPATPRPAATSTVTASTSTANPVTPIVIPSPTMNRTPGPTTPRVVTGTPTPYSTPTARAKTIPTSARSATPVGSYIANFATWQSGIDTRQRFRRTYDRSRDEYQVAVLQENQEWSFFAPEGRKFQDFTLEVDANSTSGSDTLGYGLVFRRQTRQEGSAASERYIFYLTPQGRYSLIQINADSTRRTLRPLDAPSIPSVIAAGSGSNRLRVTCQGAKITLAINDTEVFSLNNAAITQGGAIGVFVKTPPGIAEAAVAFRRLMLTPPR